MRTRTSTRVSHIAVSAVVLLALVLTPALAGPARIQSAATGAGEPAPRRVVRTSDDRFNDHRVLPPQRRAARAQTTTFVARFNTEYCPEEVIPWPQEARTAFSYALSLWGEVLNSTIPVVVIGCWLPQTYYDVPNWIGAMAYTDAYRDVHGAPFEDTSYVVALANAISGQDLNDNDGGDTDADGLDADAEMDGWFNGEKSNWYFGTDGNPAPNQLDFVSLVMHEVAHGLGFTGGVAPNGLPPQAKPKAYDQFTEDGFGTRILDYEYNSNEIRAALRGQAGGLFFDGPASAASNGGPVRLYAPDPWKAASYHHLDEQTFNNTPNSLMTPVQNNGEVEHHPGPVTLAMFEDMGWPTVNTPPKLMGLPDHVLPINSTADNLIDLWAFASDAQSPDDRLLFDLTHIGEPNAGVTLDSNRYLDVNPAPDWTGHADVTVSVTDPGGLSDTDTFRITIQDFSKVYVPLTVGGWPAPAPQDWVTIVSEDFEAAFPRQGWAVADENGDSGRITWASRNCLASSGNRAAWCAGGGDYALECGDHYAHDAFAWMVYGPFSLADATAAELIFDWWSKTVGQDEFFYGASTDDNNYRGRKITGDHSTWSKGEVLDLSAVPVLGSLLGEEAVWIGFSFESNGSGASEGTFVDNIVVRKQVAAEGARGPGAR